MPYDQVVSEDAYLDLVFGNSAVLDYEQSVLNVSLNDQLVGSLRFSDRTTRVSNWKLNLPASAFHPGINSLYLEASLQPASVCLNTRDLRLWFSVRPESNLHFTLGPAPTTAANTRPLNLQDFPSPFYPELDRAAVILAEGDPAGWKVAAQLAFDLGRRSRGGPIDLVANYGNSVPEKTRQERDLLVVGRASTLPIMKDLSAGMPGPFDAGSDLAKEAGSGVKFRVSQDLAVGYLQVFASPWNPQRTVLAVLGNKEPGLLSASAALTSSVSKDKLNGNFAVVYGSQVQMVAAARVSASPTPGPAAPVRTTANSAPTDAAGQWGWLMGGAAGLFALVVLGAILWRIRS